MVMWDEIFEVARISKSRPRILVDAMTTLMVLKPWSLDVMVATNLRRHFVGSCPRHSPAASASRQPQI
jgi:isocitrate/isopropylmalate dehydrogenase